MMVHGKAMPDRVVLGYAIGVGQVWSVGLL